MPGFHIYLSNRSEVLVDELAHVVSTPPLPPLQKEIIIVQSKGMERWIVQQLSARFGIWANGAFPFPNSAMHDLFDAVLGELPVENPFAPELLAWRIQRLLPGYLDRPAFASLKAFAESGKRGLKLAQLCYRVADVFDQYTIHRPEMILRWERGEETHWQAQLWRALVDESAAAHRAGVRRQFLNKLKDRSFVPSRLPARISVFGLSALPSFHLEVLAATGEFVDVHLFLLNPSREFWSDILSEKEQAKRRQRERRQMQLAFPANPYFETGHPLLASLGKRGRDFSAVLLDSTEGQEWSHYEDPGEETLLACLQSDFLNLRHRGRDGFRKTIETTDTSVQIHSCHSPMREMEVLYDQILAWFESDPALRPGDILVMTPDIEAYAPYISAVFASGRPSQGHLPFSIADRAGLSSNPVTRAFSKLLELEGSRLAAPAVMDLLDIPLVRRRFGIRPEDRELLRRWVDETRICWGIDGSDRTRHGVPAFEENSWKAGLERLLLGYALPQQDDACFAGVLPYDEVEGSEGQTLGRFVEFAWVLFAAAADLQRERTLSEWSDCLLRLMDRFLAPDEDLEQEFQSLRAALKRLGELQRNSQFENSVGLDVVRYALSDRLAPAEMGAGFLTGGVTFGAMLPMRCIPFKVVVVAGLGNRAFPRTQRPPGFDLIASHPRPGDPSSRAEDRYLFLEAILSARHRLYVSYVGQSIKDNSEIPPSVVVSELIETIEQGFSLTPPGGSILDHVCIRHRLQAFSPCYFEGSPGLFSYSEENLNALRAKRAAASAVAPAQPFGIGSPGALPSAGHSRSLDATSSSVTVSPPRNVATPFVAQPLGEPAGEFRNVDLAELRRFFRNPTAYFLRKRLGIRLEEEKELAEGREPFSLGGLDAYELERDLVARKLAGQDLLAAYPAIRRRGILPAGAAGELVFEDAVASVQSFVAFLLPFLEGDPLASVDVEAAAANFHLTGRVDRIWPRHLVRYRCATVKAKDRLDLWIDHLVLQSLGIAGYPSHSVLVGKDVRSTFGPFADPGQVLHPLLDYYWEGLQAPLPFFPQTSYSFAECRRRGKKPEDALSIARKTWDGSRESRGEAEDPYYQRNWGKLDPLGERFAQLAVAIFGPLLQHEREIES
ncbi:MAG: exodeoxyribonuclease V subunit gamma [Acidimicrobiia bacterium]|nr:exodeoxyribonuclease V subunit gamma [Acidimicrobiia bacterium]